MYFAYIIKSKEGRLYIGSTNNIDKRLNEHNSGKSFWTKRYHDWQLVYKEEFQTRTEAIKREKSIKRQKGGDVFKRIIGEES